MRPAADWDAAPGTGEVPEEVRRAAGVVAWLAGLALAIWLLQSAGRGVLAPPPLSPDGLRAWLAERDGATVGFAVLRLLAVGIAWYLVVATVAGAVLRLLRAGRLLRWADAATVPAVRRLLTGAAGIGLTATSAALAAVPLPTGPLSATPASEPAPPDEPSPPATMTRLPDGTATMRRLPEPADGTAPTSTTVPSPTTTAGPSATPATAPQPTAPTTAAPPTTSPAPAPDAPRPAPPAAATTPPDTPADAPPDTPPDTPSAPAPAPAADAAPGAGSWTIEAGDHLWAVAEETLADAWGRLPADHEIAAYWADLVAANRSRLPDPANPDLVFPGTTILLPPPPPDA